MDVLAYLMSNKNGGEGGSSGLETPDEKQLAHGTIESGQSDPIVDTGVTAGDIKACRRFMFKYKAGGNVTLYVVCGGVQLFRIGANGGITQYKWIDGAKTILEQHSQKGNTTSAIGNGYIVKSPAFGQDVMQMPLHPYLLTFADVADDAPITVRCQGALSVNVDWEIRQLTT